MGKFLIGVIVGVILGILALSANPDLPRELRTALASLTAQVMRGAEEAAESVGEAADEVANEAEEATGEVREDAAEPDPGTVEEAPR
jgi:gas vesicle protein